MGKALFDLGLLPKAKKASGDSKRDLRRAAMKELREAKTEDEALEAYDALQAAGALPDDED
jgi:hypothetical protein